MKILGIALTLFLALTGAQAKTEFGSLQNAEFRIDVPDNWNHGLVVYYHGYESQEQGRSFDRSKPLDAGLSVFTKAGYAVIQSGYSRGGLALEQAIPETEALRKYFIQHYGQPRETYVTGHSMGGTLTIMTIEQFPHTYVAALDLCGAVTDTLSRIGHRFDLRVLFDYYFPGVLPDPSNVPASFELSDELQNKVFDLLQTKPDAAAFLRRFDDLRDDRDLANKLLFVTWMLKDLERRAGGNPFDNRNTIYIGTTNDNAVNDGVKRYTGNAAALAYAKRYYTPTGHLIRPVLAIHTTYDQLVSPSVPSKYAELTRAERSGDKFVLQYVEHAGHCNITPAEIETGFNELLEWKEKGIAPKPGRLP